jgi:hypothetical protein
MRKLVVLVLVALGLLLITPAMASASTPTLKSLARSLAALQKTVKSQKASIAGLKKSLSSANAKIATIQANKALTLSWLPAYLSLDTKPENGVAGPNVVLRGCNLHVTSTSSESDDSGTGNLIVGWDNAPGLGSLLRTGSNNLVCGDGNDFSSYAGFVAGTNNFCEGVAASVFGGVLNAATGADSAVAGDSNHAAGDQSTVCGGSANTASGKMSCVSGGYWNSAGGEYGSVSGGKSLSPTVDYGWCAGTYKTP